MNINRVFYITDVYCLIDLPPK